MTYSIATPPGHGSLLGFDPSNGQVTYTPAAGYVGPDSFTFTVMDDASAGPPPNLTSLPAIVSIAVTPAGTTVSTADPLAPDSAIGSLRQLIIAANANGVPDTIVLPAGTYPLTKPGPNEEAALTGDLDITEE